MKIGASMIAGAALVALLNVSAFAQNAVRPGTTRARRAAPMASTFTPTRAYAFLGEVRRRWPYGRPAYGGPQYGGGYADDGIPQLGIGEDQPSAGRLRLSRSFWFVPTSAILIERYLSDCRPKSSVSMPPIRAKWTKLRRRLPAGPHASKSTWLVLLRKTYRQTFDRKDARAADLGA
jgi:hypothetical protein